MKRTAIVAGFAVGLALFAAVAAGAAGGAAAQSDAETNGSFGSEVSSFIQISSAEAESEVNDGMFVAALERTDDPERRRALVEEREALLTLGQFVLPFLDECPALFGVIGALERGDEHPVVHFTLCLGAADLYE